MQRPGVEELAGENYAPAGPPLATLLSQALVAFTIELDNEFEHRSPHRTTLQGAGSAGAGPWLTSMVMFLNCLRYVDDEGIRVRELAERARTGTNLNGMMRWGYLTIVPAPDDRRAKTPRGDYVVRPTLKARKAREVWEPLFGEIEERWESRFGEEPIAQIRRALCVLVSLFDQELPDCMPILGYGLAGGAGKYRQRTPGGWECADSALPLCAMMARALVAFAIEYELESDLGLPIGANVLRVLNARGVRVADLPTLSGVSKEAIAMATGFLGKKKMLLIETQPGGRAKVARLTERGEMARAVYQQLIGTVEERWITRYGRDVIYGLKEPLETFVGGGTTGDSPLFRGLEPFPDGWRAKVPKPETLPHYPMVLHRGGYPDGS